MKRYLHEWIDLFEFLRFHVINSINQRYISLDGFTSFRINGTAWIFKGTAKQNFSSQQEGREEKVFST